MYKNGFGIKCLICHKTKTKQNKTNQPNRTQNQDLRQENHEYNCNLNLYLYRLILPNIQWSLTLPGNVKLSC